MSQIDSTRTLISAIQELLNSSEDILTPTEIKTAGFILAKIRSKKIQVSEEEKKQAEDIKNKGNELFKEGKLEDSIEMYTRSIELDPTNHFVYSNRALVYQKLDMCEEAEKDCLIGLSIDPSFVKFYLRLGMCCEKERALQYVEKGLEYEPGNAPLLEMKDKLKGEGSFDFGAMNSLLQNKGLQDMVHSFVKDKTPEELNEMMSGILGKLKKQ